jgi:Lar family restriction alleviation protein
MSELKPCPFCGTDAVKFDASEENTIGCYHCGIHGHGFESEAHAFNLWNTRPDPLIDKPLVWLTELKNKNADMEDLYCIGINIAVDALRDWLKDNK